MTMTPELLGKYLDVIGDHLVSGVLVAFLILFLLSFLFDFD